MPKMTTYVYLRVCLCIITDNKAMQKLLLVSPNPADSVFTLRVNSFFSIKFYFFAVEKGLHWFLLTIINDAI